MSSGDDGRGIDQAPGGMRRWFAIEGVVGAGKTTTAKLAAGRLGIQAILEHPDDHPLLRAYQQNPKLYALETELIFMVMHRSYIKEASHAEDLISDFSPAKDMIFGELALHGEDINLLKRVDERLWLGAESPTLAIFLDVPIAECLRRVQGRGRSYETDLNGSYLERLREGYLTCLSTLAKRVVKLELDGDETPSDVAIAVSGLISET